MRGCASTDKLARTEGKSELRISGIAREGNMETKTILSKTDEIFIEVIELLNKDVLVCFTTKVMIFLCFKTNYYNTY